MLRPRLARHPVAPHTAEGFDQVLWLFGDDHQVTEVGTMNLFGTPSYGPFCLPVCGRTHCLFSPLHHVACTTHTEAVPPEF